MSHGGEVDRRTEHWIYLYWRADNRLLYVGVTRTPEDRHRVHQRKSDWYPDVARYELLPSYPSGESAYRAEKVFIKYGRPIFNVMCNPHIKPIRMPPNAWRGLSWDEFRALNAEFEAKRAAERIRLRAS